MLLQSLIQSINHTELVGVISSTCTARAYVSLEMAESTIFGTCFCKHNITSRIIIIVHILLRPTIQSHIHVCIDSTARDERYNG